MLIKRKIITSRVMHIRKHLAIF